MSGKYVLPPKFTLEFRRVDRLTYQLRTSQVLSVPPEKAFTFFEDPRNLFDITPDWLDFKMVDMEEKSEVFEGAEFDYTIKWLGLTLKWRSRIIDYCPPERFTDIQIRGPYRFWSHLHTFEKAPEGMLMRDEVTYRLSLTAGLLHRFIIKRQLEDIFCYRAVRIAEWVRGD